MNLKSKITNPKKLISTFLGMFVLVGGLALGITLVEQPQLLNQKAADADYNTCLGEGVTQCVDAHTMKICAGGVWREKLCDYKSPCTNGKCITHQPTTCSSGQTKCSGNRVAVCSSGVWHESPCPNGTACYNGKCASTIQPVLHGQ